MLRLCVKILISVWFLSANLAVAEPVFAPGSRLGLELPTGFEPSDAFKGFVHRQSGGSILISELPAVAYQEMLSATDKMFASRGIIVESRQQLALKPGPALLITGKQNKSGQTFRKWLLIVGNQSFTGLLSVQVPIEQAQQIAEGISASLHTLTARVAVSMESQLQALPFEVGVTEPMRIVRLMAGNTVLMTRGPKDTIAGAAQPILLISRSKRPAPDGVPLEAVARQAFAGLKMIQNPNIEKTAQVTFAGGVGVEIVASAQTSDTGEPIVVVQSLRYVVDGYLMVLGISNAATRSTDVKMFRKIRDGVKPK